MNTAQIIKIVNRYRRDIEADKGITASERDYTIGVLDDLMEDLSHPTSCLVCGKDDYPKAIWHDPSKVYVCKDCVQKVRNTPVLLESEEQKAKEIRELKERVNALEGKNAVYGNTK